VNNPKLFSNMNWDDLHIINFTLFQPLKLRPRHHHVHTLPVNIKHLFVIVQQA